MHPNSQAHLFRDVTYSLGTITGFVADEFIVTFDDGTTCNVSADNDLFPSDAGKVEIGARITRAQARETREDGSLAKLSEWHF